MGRNFILQLKRLGISALIGFNIMAVVFASISIYLGRDSLGAIVVFTFFALINIMGACFNIYYFVELMQEE